MTREACTWMWLLRAYRSNLVTFGEIILALVKCSFSASVPTHRLARPRQIFKDFLNFRRSLIFSFFIFSALISSQLYELNNWAEWENLGWKWGNRFCLGPMGIVIWYRYFVTVTGNRFCFHVPAWPVTYNICFESYAQESIEFFI